MAGEDELIRIFKSLNFEEQLKLARGNDLQRNVFENHVWKVNYRTLKIYKSGGNFVVTNETNLNQIVLTDVEALRHFIEFYAENVKILILYLNKSPIRRRFAQDKELDYFIPIVAKSLEHLESLEFRRFCVDESFNKSENVNALLHMKNLKRLCVKHFLVSEIKYKYFCQLASKLEVLQFAGLLHPPDVDEDNSESEHSTLTHFDQLKDLQIYTSFDPKNWSHKYLRFLTTFKSLTTLSIGITDEMDEGMWKQFVTNCQELEKLSVSHTKFKNITQFFTPPKLTVLNLHCCAGLTFNNLKQILQESKLTEFTSLSVYYEGDFIDFKIATTIRTLQINESDMCKCRSAFDSNNNLKSLQWNENCTNTKCVTSLRLCKNLETLYLMPLTQVTLDTLLQLSHLRELTTSINDSAQWSCLIDLLKHFSLSDLNVQIGREVEAASTKGFLTNISTLNVRAYVEEDKSVLALDFFLDLFCQNPGLKLSLRAIDDCPELLLKFLINHEKFPTNLKTIVVRGFTLDCDDLRHKFTDTFEVVKNCPSAFLKGPDIILSWK